MKLLADENIDQPIVEYLRNDGHEVLYVLEMEPSIADEEVIKLANREKALLLTADKDFGELVFRQGKMVHGVILIRLSGLSPKNKAEITTIAIQEHARELPQNFTVIAPGAVRIRKRK